MALTCDDAPPKISDPPRPDVIRAAIGRGEIAEVVVREVMAAHSVPPAMVALRVTELRNTGPIVLPAGVKVGTIERPDGTLVPIVSSG